MMKKLKQVRKAEITSLQEFLQDIIRNADEARGARFVLRSAQEYPQIISVLRQYINASPAEVIAGLAGQYPEAKMLKLMPGAVSYIGRLQIRLKSHFQ